MYLESDPDNQKRVLITAENDQEVSILMDAMMPRALFRYFDAFRQLKKTNRGEAPPTINLTKNQLRWVGKRVAPWEKHTLSSLSEPESIKVAHQVAIEIYDYLEEPTGLSKGG